MGFMCLGLVPPTAFPTQPQEALGGNGVGGGLRCVSQALGPGMMNAEAKSEKQERKWSPPTTLHLQIGEVG